MSSNFPTSLDSYTTKASGNTIQAAHVNDLQDAVSALEAKVGADGSAVSTSHTKKIADIVTILGSASAADLTKLHAITADAAELNILDGVTSSAAELNILDGVTATTAELNKLDADNLTTGDLLTKGASALEVVAAVAAGSYLKSEGTSTKPAYGKLHLSDTGVKIKSWIHTTGTTGDQSIAGVGFLPSAVILLFAMDGYYTGVGFDNATDHMAVANRELENALSSNYSIINWISSDTGSPLVRAKFTSFNSDGGVLNWSRHDSSLGGISIVGLFLP